MTGSPRDAPAAPAHQPGRTGVVLVNHDSADDTVACVESLEASRDLDLDIVVVDNSDSPESADELRTLLGPRAEVVSSGGNLGYAGGSNVGIARCLDRGNEYVWLLNPDTRVEPETLPRLLQVFDDVPDCGVVGPRIVHPGEPATIWFDGGVVDEDKHGETRHVHQGRAVDDAPAPRRDRGRLRHRGLPAGPPDHAGDGGAAAGGLLPLLRGDRLVPPRPPGGVAGHRRPAGPDGAPQAVERGPPVALPSVLHDTEPLPLRRARPRWGSRGGAGPPARQVGAQLAAHGAQGGAGVARRVRRPGGRGRPRTPAPAATGATTRSRTCRGPTIREAVDDGQGRCTAVIERTLAGGPGCCTSPWRPRPCRVRLAQEHDREVECLRWPLDPGADEQWGPEVGRADTVDDWAQPFLVAPVDVVVVEDVLDESPDADQFFRTLGTGALVPAPSSSSPACAT